MKKSLYMLVFLIFITLSGCTESIEISFAGNGVSVESIIIEQGESVSNLQEPMLENNRFDGWFFDSALTRPVPNIFTPEEDMILHAKWVRIFDISFDSSGGTNVSNIKLEEGESFNLTQIEEPVLNNHRFEGWYLDDALTRPAQDMITPNQDIVLKAKWVRLFYDVVFNTNLGTPIQSLTLRENEIFNLNQIANPQRAGYQFVGWYLDRNFTSQASASIEIKDDLVLFARWVEYSAFDDLANSVIENGTRNEILGEVLYFTERNDKGTRIVYNEDTGLFQIDKYYRNNTEDTQIGLPLWMYLDFYIINNEIVIINVKVNYVQRTVGGLAAAWGKGEFYNIKLNQGIVVSSSRKAEHQLTNLMWSRLEREFLEFFDEGIEITLSHLLIDEINIRERVSLINNLPYEFQGRTPQLKGEIILFDISYSYLTSGEIRVAITSRMRKTSDPSGNNSTTSLYWDIIFKDIDGVQLGRRNALEYLRIGEVIETTHSMTLPSDTPIFIEVRGRE